MNLALFLLLMISLSFKEECVRGLIALRLKSPLPRVIANSMCVLNPHTESLGVLVPMYSHNGRYVMGFYKYIKVIFERIPGISLSNLFPFTGISEGIFKFSTSAFDSHMSFRKNLSKSLLNDPAIVLRLPQTISIDESRIPI
jgi:hypothetical protein